MAETLFQELKRYVGFDAKDEAALRALYPVLQPHFKEVAEVFYDRILNHEEASKALRGGESTVGRLKGTLIEWMHKLLVGPWDEEYFDLRCRIGRVHVRIALPQHYMFGAMNLVRSEFQSRAAAEPSRIALGRILDLELAIMLHTYREDLLAQHSRTERLATFGQLVGSIGHELRNPLAVIESSLYILQGRIGSDERANKHVQRICEQVTLANEIVTSLLDMIRDRPLTRGPVSVAASVAEAARAAKVPEDRPLVTRGLERLELQGDAVQLRQVFTNLLDNAIHASPEGGAVTVSGRDAGSTVEIRVEDTGAGVDPQILPRLFEPLVTNKTRGIGLGLALVKRIVERHGGVIRYERSALGGAAFCLSLPKG